MRSDTSVDIKELLEENIELSKKVLISSEKTRKYMRASQIMGIVRLLIILVPVILAILYIPPFLTKFSDTFGKLYGGEQFNILEALKGQGTNMNFDDVKSFLDKQTK